MSYISRIKHNLIPLVYILAMGWSVLYGFLHPFCNWDMLCYMGTVVSWSEKDPQAIYDKTMAAAREGIPDWVYDQHIHNPISAEYTAFNDQIPCCKIKPLYTGSVWLLHQMGVQLAKATWSISSMSLLILVIVLYRWRPEHMHQHAWYLLVLLISFVWEIPLADMGRLSTPDAMGTMLSMFSFYAWLQKRSFLGFAALGWLSTIARPDAMIITGAATVYFGFLAPQEWRTSRRNAIMMMLALGVSYEFFKHAFGSYTFSQYFIHSLVAISPHPGQITQPLTLQLWWFIFSGSLIRFFTYGRVITLSIIALLGFLSYYLKPSPPRRLWRDLLLLTLVSWATRFVLWPSWGDYRFYFTYSLMLLLCSGELIAPYAAFLWHKLTAQRRLELQQNT